MLRFAAGVQSVAESPAYGKQRRSKSGWQRFRSPSMATRPNRIGPPVAREHPSRTRPRPAAQASDGDGGSAAEANSTGKPTADPVLTREPSLHHGAPQ